MLYQCPHCQNELEVDENPPPEHLDCDVCGSSFASEPDATLDYIPIARHRKSQFAHFEMLKEVGRGSHGSVWRARDTRLDRTVAVKIQRPDVLHPDDVDRFLMEAQAAAQLKHPGIVSIHDTGRVDEIAYIATDFVDGSTLDRWMKDRTVTPVDAARVCAEVADALHHAHESGVIHRDIKPSNIIIDESGHPFVTDFGLAKRESIEATIAIEGSLLGTPAYMSPEQARGEAHTADRRSDLYSLGVILFQMLTGERPFRGTRQRILQQVVEADAPNPRRLNPNIPDDLDTICSKCLQKEPTHRYESTSELADELRRFLRGEPIKARPITQAEYVLRWCRRNPVVASLVAGLAVALIVGFVGITTQWVRANLNAATAAVEAERASRAADMAQAARESTMQYLYVAHMNMAQQAYELADPLRVIEILQRHRPDSDGVFDRRSFDWYYWWRQAQRWSKSLQHPLPLNAVAVSADGAVIATAMVDGTITLWNTVSGEQLAELSGHEGKVFDLAFSPVEPMTLVSSGRDRTLRFWNTETQAETSKTDLERALFSVTFSQDGKTLVTGGADLSVRQWDVDPLKERRSMEGHFDFVYGVAISNDGSKIASAGLDRTVRIWDGESGELLHTLDGHVLEVWSVAFSPDGERLASGSADNTVRLWDVEQGTEITTLQGHTDRVRAVSFSPDGLLLVSASHDRTIRLWDMTAESKPLEVFRRDTNRRDDHFFERMQLPNSEFPKDEFKGHAGHVTGIQWSANGKTLVSSSVDHTARVWNVSELQQRQSLADHTKTVNAIAISVDGRTMLSGSNDRTARFWDLATMQQVGPPVEHGHLVLAVALSPDQKMYATGSYDGVVKLGPLTGSSAVELADHERAISTLAFSPNSSMLASGSHDGSVRIWDVETGQMKRVNESHQGRVQSVVFLSNDLIASSGADNTIRLWNPATGEQSQELDGHTDSIWALAVSSDGGLLASGSEDQTIRLWDLNDGGRLLRTIEGHAEAIRSVAFCPDGRTIASGSDDKTIKLWDVVTGEPKSTFKGHKYRVWSLAFTPDSQQLLSASLIIRVWNAPREP